MANPNIVNITSLIGKTDSYILDSTNQTLILDNPPSSNKSLRVNGVIVSNVDGTNSADISLSYHALSGGGGTPTKIASTLPVPADTTIVLLDKAIGLYLEENTSLTVLASAADDLHIVVTYEEIT